MDNVTNKNLFHLGLKPLRPDRRDFSFHRTFGSADLSQLPIDFDVESSLSFPNQGYTDFCSAYTVTDVCSDEDKQIYSPDFQFAMTKKIENSTDYGADLRDAFSVPVSIGLITNDISPYHWEKDGRDLVATPTNWGKDMLDKALSNRKLAYFHVDGPYDIFDQIRSAIWLNKAEKRSVGVGTPWYYEWNNPSPNGVIIEGYTSLVSYHAYKICGWKTINGNLYLKAKQWAGPSYGDNGFFYLSREIVNREFDKVGSARYMIKKTDPEVVRNLQLQNQPFGAVLLELFQRIISMIKGLNF